MSGGPHTGAPHTGATDPTILAVLSDGDLELEGRLVEASNTTVRCVASLDGVRVRCVYKPVAGERPLWDFPDGTLAGREVAAYLLSRATGWDLVPPTVLRDGPFGPGACQLWIEETPEHLVGFVPDDHLPPTWHPVLAAEDDTGTRYTLAHADDPRLARMAVFDALANNADRKGGHVLVGAGDRVYGVDHGVCFHVAPKLRTVLWGFAGTALPEEALAVLARVEQTLAGTFGRELADHLAPEEVAAVGERAARLRQRGRFPRPGPDQRAIPWPPM